MAQFLQEVNRGRRAVQGWKKEWDILNHYHEGDWIFSAPQAGLMPPEDDSTQQSWNVGVAVGFVGVTGGRGFDSHLGCHPFFWLFWPQNYLRGQI